MLLRVRFKKKCVTFLIFELQKRDAYQNGVEFQHKSNGNGVLSLRSAKSHPKIHTIFAQQTRTSALDGLANLLSMGMLNAWILSKYFHTPDPGCSIACHGMSIFQAKKVRVQALKFHSKHMKHDSSY